MAVSGSATRMEALLIKDTSPMLLPAPALSWLLLLLVECGRALEALASSVCRILFGRRSRCGRRSGGLARDIAAVAERSISVEADKIEESVGLRMVAVTPDEAREIEEGMDEDAEIDVDTDAEEDVVAAAEDAVALRLRDTVVLLADEDCIHGR